MMISTLAASPRLPAKEQYEFWRDLAPDALPPLLAEFAALPEADQPHYVGFLRAVGVVASLRGRDSDREGVRAWLGERLAHGDSRVRRYAAVALGKVGLDPTLEAVLLALRQRHELPEAEAEALETVLTRHGSPASLAKLAATPRSQASAQGAEARLARLESPSTLHLDRRLGTEFLLPVLLDCRTGLEELLREEFLGHRALASQFSLGTVAPGRVRLVPRQNYAIAGLQQLRLNFRAVVLVAEGSVPVAGEPEAVAEALAEAIGAERLATLLGKLTTGPLRYRLDFPERGHQRALTKAVAAALHRRAPALLNDSRAAPWVVEVEGDDTHWQRVTLGAHQVPDPRFAYRVGDIPAASHPPLAAAMVWLAGSRADDIALDPFCGTGLELIERARRSPVARLVGTDRDAEALAKAQQNLLAAGFGGMPCQWQPGDFRTAWREAGLAPGQVTLLLTNPPMGRRIPVPSVRALVADLFAMAAQALARGGRLVFPNPVAVAPPPAHGLVQTYRQRVDLGGFDCHLERWEKRS